VSYSEIEVSVRILDNALISAGNTARWEFKIDENILFKLAAEGTGILKTEKKETKRGLTGLRAPPGGPIAVRKVVSLIFFQFVDSPDLKLIPRS
jgi:hypothetical protein